MEEEVGVEVDADGSVGVASPSRKLASTASSSSAITSIDLDGAAYALCDISSKTERCDSNAVRSGGFRALAARADLGDGQLSRLEVERHVSFLRGGDEKEGEEARLFEQLLEKSFK